ncbi:hypothetical protein [Streptomyces sp. WM6368]|uniref:hypothetical protein n=1 Tax=Streptomyces sp. WM6368 TaxID=1415554 RepID=UPI0006AFC286|nr:hypothetical protein [Streptomyces sp. WM6368]KOU37240.1 hypothetical protein ADK51_01165 [Streptomyces sp. WM6368]
MDFTVIANAVEVDHGIKRLSMRFIKKYADPDRDRLSREFCDQITAALAELKLITLPTRLPTSENEFVFVIERDSPIGQAVRMASSIAELEKLDMNPFPRLSPHTYPAMTDYLA